MGPASARGVGSPRASRCADLADPRPTRRIASRRDLCAWAPTDAARPRSATGGGGDLCDGSLPQRAYSTTYKAVALLTQEKGRGVRPALPFLTVCAVTRG